MFWGSGAAAFLILFSLSSWIEEWCPFVGQHCAAWRCTLRNIVGARSPGWAAEGLALPTPHGKVTNNPLFYQLQINWKEHIQTSLQGSWRERCRQDSANLVTPCVLALAVQDPIAPARTELGALCQRVSMPRVWAPECSREYMPPWRSLSEVHLSKDQHRSDIHIFPFLPQAWLCLELGGFMVD